MYDVSIIGGGIIGAAIARELAKYHLKICLIEKEDDVGSGTTKANSGIVHGGYSDKPNTLKAKLCAKGNSMYQKLNDELKFGFARTGSLVIGFNDQDREKIKELFSYGQKNGVPELAIVDGEFVRNKEPHLSKDITVALYCPTAGVTSPYEFAIALTENAIQNGVELKLNTKITTINITKDSFILTTDNNESITTKMVINAAGLYADEIAKMVGLNEFVIKPRSGQYLLFDKDEGNLVNSIIFQVPNEISKGVLVTKTYHGNLLIGPDANEITDKNNLDTNTKNLEAIVCAARKSLPNIDLKKVITSFAGNRAASDVHDFIIEKSKIEGFINVASVESPGLTAAPAIAEYVIDLIKTNDRINLVPNKNFDPYRKHNNAIVNMAPNELNKLIKYNHDYGCVVCRCETVSLGEIKECLHKNIPVNSLDAIKRRTRAGMGRCQGGFCTPKIIETIHEELKIPKEKITKKGRNSVLLTGKTK